MKRFCARCGAEIGLFEAANLENLCTKCYLEVHGPPRPPSTVNITLCRKCYSVKFRGKWHPLNLTSDSSVASRLARAVESEVERACGLKLRATMTPSEAYSLISGEPVLVKIELEEKVHPSIEPLVKTHTVEVKCSFSICPTCLKVAGKRFEATVQLRGFSLEELERIKVMVNRLILERSGGSHNIQTGASWEEVEGGADIRLPSADMARRIANAVKRNFNVQVKETYKDAGWDRSRGRPWRTLTILLRARNP